MKKIVVFGASGEIGRYFIKYFLSHLRRMNIRSLQQVTERLVSLNN